MTLEELRARTMVQANIDEDDLDEYKTRIDGYLNIAYMEMALEQYRPWLEETATPANGAVDYGALRKKPLEVLTATDAQGRTYPCEVRADLRQVRVNAACALTIRYLYTPKKLEEDDDTPVLPAWAHDALADYATYRLLINGNLSKQQRAAAFRVAYDEAYRRIEPYGKDTVRYKQFRNLYARG